MRTRSMNSQSRPHPRPPAYLGTCLARALSKLGFCSRSQAASLIKQGLVRVNGVVRANPEWRIALERDRIEVDGQQVRHEAKVYVMLNKPRGLVTTASDERGRETVFQCLAGRNLPFVGPVGRLDKASEGLLLFTNDAQWAARIASPDSRLDKTYHVQVDCLADNRLVNKMLNGATVDGDFLHAKRVTILRHGTRNSWLEIVLDEGKNRHIRRLLSALGVGVLRLIRISIGGLPLGPLPKGEVRHLTDAEVNMLAERDRSGRGPSKIVMGHLPDKSHPVNHDQPQQ
jgi:23S rRNA pseudouridine2605 synthase